MSDEDYIETWTRRVLSNAPSDETPEDVLRLIQREPYLNRGRWAAYVVRLGAAEQRRRGDDA